MLCKYQEKYDDNLNQSTKYNIAIHKRVIEEVQMISTADRADKGENIQKDACLGA